MQPSSREGDENSRSFIEIARRGQIVECAIETIAELGYAQASLAQIAKRAKISKGVISYHFTSKSDLMQQIISDVFTMGGAFMQPRIAAEKTTSGMLRAYIESNIAFMRTHRPHLVALVDIVTNARADDGKPLLDASKYDPAIAELGALLQGGQERGEFGPFSPSVMAVSIRAAIDAIPPQMARKPDLDLDSYARELADLFERATRK